MLKYAEIIKILKSNYPPNKNKITVKNTKKYLNIQINDYKYFKILLLI